MDREVLQRRVLELLADRSVLVTPEELHGADLFQLGLDSLNVVSFLFALEDEFQVEFDVTDLSPEHFSSVAAVTDLLWAQLQESASSSWIDRADPSASRSEAC
jgi:acyl carrier protein